MVKRYEELTISDDFLFGKAMGVQGRQRAVPEGWNGEDFL